MKIKAGLFVSFCCVALVSCGGGGGAAGDSDTFAVAPGEIKISHGKGDVTCSGSKGARTTVTIVGGQAPFRIVNSSPQLMSVDRTEVAGQDPQFVVTSLGQGCGEDLSVLVLDLFSKSVTFNLTLEKGDDADDTTPAATPPAATPP